jgi:hypothetical protein
MKKLLLAVLFSAITIIGFSQTTSYAYKLETGVWNTYTKKWMWQDLIDIDLTFTLGKTYIKIDDKANTFLSIIEQDGSIIDDDKMHSARWTCSDEMNRRCSFSMTYFKESGTNIYNIMYNDKCFRYYIKKDRIDNFNL